jgi:hypothetical protein
MKIKIEDSSEDGAAQDLAKEVRCTRMFCICTGYIHSFYFLLLSEVQEKAFSSKPAPTVHKRPGTFQNY